MRRGWRIAATAIAAVAAAFATTSAVPGGVRACSCVPWPETVAAYRTDANVLVIAGTVVALNGQRGTFGIEQVFKGPVPGPQMPIDGGDPGMCGLGVELGQRLVMAVSVEAGVLRPSSCMPAATLPSPEGDAMLADAASSYGTTIPPPGVGVDATDPPTAPDDAGPGGSSGISAALALPVILGGVLLAVVLLFGAIAVLSRRRSA